MEQNTVALVMFEIRRGVNPNDTINITSVASYNGGLLVCYAHSYHTGGKLKGHTVTEHRTAFFQLVSVTTDNDSLWKKWDFIC